MATITLTSAQASDPTAVQAVLTSAADGDTIIAPAGRYTWAKQVSLSGKSIKFLGAAKGAVSLVNNIPPGTTWATRPLLSITGSTRSTLEVANLAFEIGSANSSGAYMGISQISLQSAPGKPYYFHDCVITTNSAIAKGLQLYTNGGLSSKNTFKSDPAAYADGVVLQSWQDTYASASTMGTLDDGTKNTYVEDCTFENFGVGYSLDMSDCARFVVRHNKFINSYIGSHGQESAPFGCRHYEIYDNTFTVPDTSSNCQDFCWLRGGTGVIFRNSFDPAYYKTCIMMQILALTKREQIGCPTKYPIPRQVGQGWSGGSGSYSYPDWPANGAGYITDPLYIWDNTKNPSVGWVNFGDSSPDQCAVGGVNRHSADYIKQDRDYFLNAGAKPGYTAFAYPHPLASGVSTPPPDGGSPPPSQSSPAVIQYGPAGQSSSNATYAMTPFASPIVDGNAVFVFVSWQTNSGTIARVSDNLNAGDYTLVPGSWAQGSSGCSGAWFYKLNSKGGSPTVTVVRSTGQTGGNMAGYEVSGVDAATPIDAGAVAKAGSTGAGTVTVGSVTTQSDAALLLVGYRGTFSSLGAGWASNQTGSHTLGNMMAAAPGSYTASANASESCGWVGSFFAIRLTSGGPPPPTGATYENWILQQNDWIRSHPPTPD